MIFLFLFAQYTFVKIRSHRFLNNLCFWFHGFRLICLHSSLPLLNKLLPLLQVVHSLDGHLYGHVHLVVVHCHGGREARAMELLNLNHI